jgi:hypothetical protein
VTSSYSNNLETKQLRDIHVRSFLRRVLDGGCLDDFPCRRGAAKAVPVPPPWIGHLAGASAASEENACARRGGANRTVMRLPAGHLSAGES